MIVRENDFALITSEEVGNTVTIKRKFVVEVEAPTPEDPQAKAKEPKEFDIVAKIISYRTSKSEKETDLSEAEPKEKALKYPVFAYINPITKNTIIEEPTEITTPFGTQKRVATLMFTAKSLRRLFEFTMVATPIEAKAAEKKESSTKEQTKA